MTTYSTRRTPYRTHRLALLTIAIALSPLIGLPLTALADNPVSSSVAQNETRFYQIPAGSLESVLNQFALAAGIELSIASPLVAGKTSEGLHGEYRLAEAFTRLLAGSNLTYRSTGTNSFALEPAKQVGVLSKVKVEADVISNAVTEGTGSYSIESAGTAVKLQLSPRETPQTLTVVTRQQIDDFAMSTVDDILESTSGTHVFQQGNNGALYYSRGFEMQSQYDGITNPIGIGEWNRNPSPDNAFLDHVEVLQGASGLLNGAGEPGGTINLIRKKPTTEFKSHIETQLGSWNKKRLVGDVSGSLSQSGGIRARAVTVWDDSDSFVDYAFDKKRGVYGVVDADITETTTVSASIQYQENDARNHLGVPMGPNGSDLGLKRSSYFGNANSSHKKDYTLYTLGIEQQLSSDWSLKSVYNHGKTNVDTERGSFPGGGPLNVETGNGLRMMQHRYLQREFTADALDIYANGSVEAFGRRHELVVGGNGQKLQEATYNSGNVPTAINIYTFDPTQLPTPAILPTPFYADSAVEQYGLYGAARLNLADPLKVILGTRVSWYESENAGVKSQDESAVLSPYMGVVYDVSDRHSFYASYSDIFKPQSNLNRNGNSLEPVVGVNYEAGIKGEYYNGRLNSAAAIFRLEQTNLARIDEEFGNDPTNICGGWCYSAQDKIISEGIDLSMQGELSAGWNIGTGYTYVASEYNTGAQKGTPYRTDVPEQLFRIFTSYRLPGDKWVIGGHLNTQSRFYNSGVRNGIAWRVEQGSLSLVGLMAKYQLNQNAEINFTADNIFDRRYFASTNSLYYVPYGEPRRLALTVRYTF